MDYPVYLALGYLILVAYIARTLFMSVRLPGAVGVLLAGWAWSTFAQDDILASRADLQTLAFFLVLLIGGFHISLKDLSLPLLVMSVLPMAFEIGGLMGFAMCVFGMSMVQGLIMATCFCAVSDGIVIPKMKEFGERHPGHPLPRLVFAWVPLEGTFALTLFGILSGFAKAKADVEVAIWRTVLANVLRIVITVGLGWVIGHVSAVLIPQRTKFSIMGRQVFTGATVEAFLLIFGVSLSAFGLGEGRGHEDAAFIPIGLAPGAFVQPELLVIVLGIVFGDRVTPELLHDVEAVLGGVWVFGQLFLYGMIGSKTTMQPFRASAGSILPCMLFGLLCRAIGIVLGLHVTRRRRAPATADKSTCEVIFQANRRSFLFDAGFCFLAMLPRASIQGALLDEPNRRGFFSDAGAQGEMATKLIANGGKIYIIVLAVLGTILLDLFGSRLLQTSMDRASLPQEVLDEESRIFHEGWTARFRRWRQRTGQTWDDRLTDFERSVRVASTLHISLGHGLVDRADAVRKVASWSPAGAPAKDLFDPLTRGMDIENPTDAAEQVRRCRSGPSSLETGWKCRSGPSSLDTSSSAEVSTTESTVEVTLAAAAGV
jgi:hypothetical protein